MLTIIRGGLTLDCTGRDPLAGGVVVIEDGQIAAVGTTADFPEPPAGAQIIDASGCTVLPGLIDGHVHVLGHPRRNRFDEAEAAIWGGSYLRAALRGGLTTVRDVGAQYDAIFALKRGVQSGWLPGPRLLVAGRAICMTGGHVHDTYSVEADGPDAVRQAARQQIKAGADVVKLIASGGAGTRNEQPTSVQLGVEEMRAGVEEAHKAGLPAAAHATVAASIKNALRAGVDSIEHGCYLDDEALELMLKQGAVLSPTLSIYPRMVEANRFGIAPDFMAQRAANLVGPHFESVQKALAAGVRIVMGTDCASPWHPVGDVAYELELWVRAGLQPRLALEAATRRTAEACRVGQEVGTLEPGKRADVLVVEGDALADIGAMRRVRRVLRDGITVYDGAPEAAGSGPAGKPVMGPLPEWLYR